MFLKTYDRFFLEVGYWFSYFIPPSHCLPRSKENRDFISSMEIQLGEDVRGLGK